MNKITHRIRIADIFYIVMMIVPVVFSIILKILTTPKSDGISISGARIFFTLNMPIQDMPITESQVNSGVVMISVLFLCLYLTHGINNGVWLKRHHLAEWIVEKSTALVTGNMGEYFKNFSPFIAAILALSAFSSLLTLFGLYLFL